MLARARTLAVADACHEGRAQVDLLLTALTFAVGLVTLVAGIFGMNLHNGWDAGGGGGGGSASAAFIVVSTIASAAAVAFIVVFVVIMRRKRLAFV